MIFGDVARFHSTQAAVIPSVLVLTWLVYVLGKKNVLQVLEVACVRFIVRRSWGLLEWREARRQWKYSTNTATGLCMD